MKSTLLATAKSKSKVLQFKYNLNRVYKKKVIWPIFTNTNLQ